MKRKWSLRLVQPCCARCCWRLRGAPPLRPQKALPGRPAYRAAAAVPEGAGGGGGD